MLCKFKKMQGIGNDFVLLDSFFQSFSLTTKQIKHIANRRYGVGCDQVLLLEPPKNKETDVLSSTKHGLTRRYFVRDM